MKRPFHWELNFDNWKSLRFSKKMCGGMAKIVGISCSPRENKFTSNLVKEILAGTKQETEFIFLAGKEIKPCQACLRCVNDNICKQNDDWSKFQDKLLKAKALVIGAPNYYGGINSLAHVFLERFYAFRHMGLKMKGKKVVLAAVGCVHPEQVENALTKFAEFNELEVVGTVTCKGTLSCLICGNGEVCPVSGAKMIYGKNVKITPDMILHWKDRTDVQNEAQLLGKKLAHGLQK